MTGVDDIDVSRFEREVAALQAQFVAELRRIDELSEAKTHAVEQLMDAKFVTYRTMIDANAGSVSLALAAADKAVLKAEQATEKRFEGVNEFRASLADLSSTMASRRELEASGAVADGRHAELVKAVTDLRSRLDRAPELHDLATRAERSEALQIGSREQRQETRSNVGYAQGLIALFLVVAGLLGYKAVGASPQIVQPTTTVTVTTP